MTSRAAIPTGWCTSAGSWPSYARAERGACAPAGLCWGTARVGYAPTMEKLESYVAGEWSAARGKLQVLVNPTTEAPLAEAGTEGIDFAAAVRFARVEGGPVLRALTFVQRGEILRAMSRA